jgi:hypothetical protein
MYGYLAQNCKNFEIKAVWPNKLLHLLFYLLKSNGAAIYNLNIIV